MTMPSETEEAVLQREDPCQMHAANLFYRFVLELGALGAMGWWGYDQIDGSGRYVLMMGVPLVAAMAWGIFTVPSDPSRGQQGQVLISGITRLILEAVVFGFATWALYSLGEEGGAAGFGSAVIVHYALSWRRIAWLVKH